jgi:hypothetical protein
MVLSLNLIPTEAELGWAATGSVVAVARHPGVGANVTSLGNATRGEGGRWELAVPLVRGMALVIATLFER